MAKCTDCNMCMGFVWIDDVRYLQCSLCNRLYTVEGKKITPYVEPTKAKIAPKEKPVLKKKSTEYTTKKKDSDTHTRWK